MFFPSCRIAKENGLSYSTLQHEASCWSVEYDNPFSLAILHDGKNMIGKKLFALSPVKNKSIAVEIVSSHYVDPKGTRVRS